MSGYSYSYLPKVIRQLRLNWGVIPYLASEVKTTDEVFELGKNLAIKSGYVKKGDVVVITAGTPVGTSGTTNTLRIQNIGDILIQGDGVGDFKLAAEVLNLADLKDDEIVNRGERYIIVGKHLEEKHRYLLDNAAGLILESANVRDELRNLLDEKNIALIYNCNNAVKILKNQMQIFMDTKTGLIH